MKRTSLVFSGFKLGMLLQIGGVGPICLLLFQLPAFLSLSSVLFGVLGVTLADSLYIGLAAAGIAPLVKRIKAADRTFKIISGMVLMALGLFFVSFTTQDMRIMPIAEWLKKNVFWGLFLLTIMNPATIAVFTGIFTAEIVNRKFSVKELLWFAFGIVWSTPVFLGSVSVIGFFCDSLLPSAAIKILNAAVGLILIYWGISRFLPRRKLCGVRNESL